MPSSNRICRQDMGAEWKQPAKPQGRSTDKSKENASSPFAELCHAHAVGMHNVIKISAALH